MTCLTTRLYIPLVGTFQSFWLVTYCLTWVSTWASLVESPSCCWWDEGWMPELMCSDELIYLLWYIPQPDLLCMVLPWALYPEIKNNTSMVPMPEKVLGRYPGWWRNITDFYNLKWNASQEFTVVPCPRRWEIRSIHSQEEKHKIKGLDVEFNL